MNTLSKCLLLICFVFSCAPKQNWPALEEIHNEIDAGTLVQTLDLEPTQLVIDMNLRTLQKGVLEFLIELPAGTRIQVSENYQVYLNDFRNTQGELARSSTGFISPIKILSVPTAYQTKFPPTFIQKLNSTPTGLFISAATLIADETPRGNFNAITPSVNGVGFLKYYYSNGRPKFNYTTKITSRFGPRLNKAVDPKSLTSAQKTKWMAVYNELKRVANRTVAAPKSLLLMDNAKAETAFLHFDKHYVVPKFGAWTIATKFTAVRHGFPNVPCAEFQSEMIRQAFARAGYNVLNDFNASKGNLLFWNNTSSVKNLSEALYKAGWVPWLASKYKPLTGAIMFHAAGTSPGHAYISGGDDGRIIVDNGAPQGRDLRKTTQNTISIQYQTGLFFLPPGINPPMW